MKVSVIIVNYNTVTLLNNCINAIKQKTENIEYEIIVVDNASIDDSVKLIREKHPDVKCIGCSTNIGFGRANNVGARSASGDYFFFLNSDTVLNNNAIKYLADFLDHHSTVGICGGNLVTLEGNPIHSFGKKLPGPFADLLRFYPPIVRLIMGRDWEYNFGREAYKVGYITGADLMIRANLFQKLGGFDPNFFMYYEETDLTTRVIKTGYDIFSVPDAVITHIKGASLESLSNVSKLVMESKYYYLRKHFGKHNAYIAHFIFSLYCLSKQLFFTVFNRKDRAKRFLHMRINDNFAFEKGACER